MCSECLHATCWLRCPGVDNGGYAADLRSASRWTVAATARNRSDLLELTFEEFKRLDELVGGGHSDELLAHILPHYNTMRVAAERLREVDLSGLPPALVYRAGSVK